jgi:hypothetical protein
MPKSEYANINLKKGDLISFTLKEELMLVNYGMEHIAIVKEINKLVNLEGMKSWKKVQHTKHFEYDDYIIVTCLNGGTIQQIRTNVIDKIEKLTS